jgi:hypothetical protein
LVLKEISARLQLKFDEYIETWSGLLTECYSRGLDKPITDALELDDEGLVKYSMELASVILVIGMRLWTKSRISSDIKEKVREAVVDSFYREIYSDKTGTDFLSGCMDFFTEGYKTFSELCPNLGGKDKEKQRIELVGLARYICAQVSKKPEEKNMGVFEKIGLVLISTMVSSEKLTRNSSLDIQFPFAKPKFIVQQ